MTGAAAGRRIGTLEHPTIGWILPRIWLATYRQFGSAKYPILSADTLVQEFGAYLHYFTPHLGHDVQIA